MNKRTLRRIALGAICLAATLCALPAPLHAAPALPRAKPAPTTLPPTRCNGTTLPQAATRPWACPSTTSPKALLKPAPTTSAASTRRRSTTNTPTPPSPPSSRARPRTRTRASSARFCTRKSATPSKWSSRTTPHIPTACIPTAFSTRRTPKARTTTATAATWTTVAAASRPAQPTLTPGRFPNAPDPAPTIPVPSSGSTTRTATSCATWPQACSAASSSRAAAWRAPTALRRMSTSEFVTIFIAINENESWYLDDNIKAHIPIPSKLNRYEFKPDHCDTGSSAPSPVRALSTPTSSGPSTDTSTATCP